MQAKEAREAQTITVELHLGTEGIQAGCVAITVRRGDLFTQTPWLIIGETEGAKIARRMLPLLREQYPSDAIVTVGFQE